LRFRVFAACRLRYRYQYVDRLSPRLRPADTCGTLVHRVLCDFFSKVPEAERAPGRLLQMFADGWEGLSPRYRRMDGVGALRETALRQLAAFARQHDLSARPFAVEAYIETEIAPGVILFGRVDRIDEEPDGSLHVIDYKTGGGTDDCDVWQLRLYAIMVEQKAGRRVSRASFWRLDDGRISTLDLTAREKQLVLEQTLKLVTEMESLSEYPATVGPDCAHCPYLHACEFRDDVAARRAAEGW
jgi:putative RecB family exonuclease